jgi:hypothetical protein
MEHVHICMVGFTPGVFASGIKALKQSKFKDIKIHRGILLCTQTTKPIAQSIQDTIKSQDVSNLLVKPSGHEQPQQVSSLPYIDIDAMNKEYEQYGIFGLDHGKVIVIPLRSEDIKTQHEYNQLLTQLQSFMRAELPRKLFVNVTGDRAAMFIGAYKVAIETQADLVYQIIIDDRIYQTYPIAPDNEYSLLVLYP